MLLRLLCRGFEMSKEVTAKDLRVSLGYDPNEDTYEARLAAFDAMVEKAEKGELFDKLMLILEEKSCISIESKNSNSEEQYWIMMPAHISGTGFTIKEAIDEAYSEAGLAEALKAVPE